MAVVPCSTNGRGNVGSSSGDDGGAPRGSGKGGGGKGCTPPEPAHSPKVEVESEIDECSWDNGRTSGSQYIGQRVRRSLPDDDNKRLHMVDGTIVKWLPAHESDFTSDITHEAAALWHIVFDDPNVGEVNAGLVMFKHVLRFRPLVESPATLLPHPLR
jgi:hypothetical protein